MTIVNAARFVRKMRGGAQAHLVRADDGFCYVVKFRNNPQHRRILVNEFVASTFLRYLQVAVPETAIVNLSEAFLEANPEVGIVAGHRSIPVESGWHFGSRYPGCPDSVAVYDMVPDSLFPKIANLEDFRAALVFDRWMANTDARQCIFFRALVRQTGSSTGQPAFVARMIDNGHVFNGAHWNFPESAVQGLYWRKQIYGPACDLEDFQPWLAQVENFPEEVFDEVLKRVPPQWIEGDEDHFERLLETLFRRRKRIRTLLGSSCLFAADRLEVAELSPTF